MTVKQIVDDVDVSECEYLTETRHCKANMAVMGTDANRCKCFPNCHYKQLVREKQECEKLKKQYNYKQALDEIEKYLDEQQKYFDGEDYHNLLDIINEVKEQ